MPSMPLKRVSVCGVGVERANANQVQEDTYRIWHHRGDAGVSNPTPQLMPRRRGVGEVTEDGSDDSAFLYGQRGVRQSGPPVDKHSRKRRGKRRRRLPSTPGIPILPSSREE